jgi:hypothetical protein
MADIKLRRDTDSEIACLDLEIAAAQQRIRDARLSVLSISLRPGNLIRAFSSVLQGAHTTDDRLTRMSDEVSQLTAKICKLRTRRNALTPFGRLLEEILAQILVYCIFSEIKIPDAGDEDEATLELYETDSEPFSGRWTRVMLVSSRLRDVALSSQEVWTVINLSRSPLWNKLCATRAGPSPLTIISPQQGRRDLLSSLAPWLGRAASAHILGARFSNYLGAVDDVVASYGSGLRSLTYAAGVTYVDAPQDFLHGAPELLQDLSLVNLCLAAELYPCRFLVRLELAHIIVKTPAHFFSFIGEAPCLEYVCLTDVVFTEDMPPIDPLVLPCLLELRVEVALSWMSLLMRVLPLPKVLCSYSIIAKRNPWHVDTISDKMRQESFDQALSILHSTDPALHIATSLHTGPKQLGIFSEVDYCLTICHEHRSICRPVISYTDLIADTPVGFSDLLTGTEKVLVSSAAAHHIFKHAVKFPDLLASVQRIVIQCDDDCGLVTLVKWLQMRFDAGTRVELVDLQDAYRYEAGSAENGMFRVAVAEIAFGGLAGEILRNGQPVALEAYTSAIADLRREKSDVWLALLACDDSYARR